MCVHASVVWSCVEAIYLIWFCCHLKLPKNQKRHKRHRANGKPRNLISFRKRSNQFVICESNSARAKINQSQTQPFRGWTDWSRLNWNSYKNLFRQTEFPLMQWIKSEGAFFFWGLRKLFNYTPLIYYPNEFRWKTFQRWGHSGTMWTSFIGSTFIVATIKFLSSLNTNGASAKHHQQKLERLQ